MGAIVFLPKNRSRISKIALVGDAKWKEDIFMFMGQQMLKTAIEFFPLSQLAKAKAWLWGDNTQFLFGD
ncbi:MAG: STAS/SEC14 domain-containing protein [Methylosarcina sp.]